MRVIPSAVLFACSENSIRSPMAEGILKFLHGHRVYVDSVGVRKREINGFVVTVMEEIGVDMSLHKSKTFSDLEDLSYDLVILAVARGPAPGHGIDPRDGLRGGILADLRPLDRRRSARKRGCRPTVRCATI